MNNEILLQSCCDEMGVSLIPEMVQQFMTYKDVLLEWNDRINLTTITQEREIMLKHFADCLTLLPYLDLGKGTKVIDVGTGAGFPGIPLKIVCPEISLTLLDSLQKRISFLEEVIDTISLSGVECVHSRAEDGGQNPRYREQFDYCVSRAVANLAVLSEYCLPFVKVGGKLVALKGPELGDELSTAESALEKLGAKVVQVVDVAIPYTDLSHKLVVIEKISSTPSIYPRRASKIQKKPL